MSHLPERKEKSCLNCGTITVGRFCYVCGQENVEPKESLFHLVTHFFNDVTHFDGKFFSSLKYLITKPGFLSKEYVKGKRARYLNPIRMYLFTSAIFFLVFSSIFKINVGNVDTGVDDRTITEMDSLAFQALTVKENNGIPISREALKAKLDSNQVVTVFFNRFSSRQQYDSLLKAGARHDNWTERKLIYKSIDINAKYKNRSGDFLNDLSEKFIHTLPQMLFVLLPIFALILKLLYIRKEYYYTDHLIHALHMYIFNFIAMMAIFGVSKIADVLHSGWIGYISTALTLSIFFYFYKSLRNFYMERRARTILKYFIVLFLLFFISLILFSLFIFLSFLQI